MSKFLKKLKRKTKNPYAFIADEENNIYSGTTFTTTGTPILNALLTGDIDLGIEDGKRYLFAGEPSTGKSILTAFIVKSYLELNPDAISICFESEGSTILQMCDDIGIDKSRILVIPVKTVEDFRHEVLSNLKQIREENEDKPRKQWQKAIFWADSIGNLSTNKEIGDIENGKDTTDMTRAKLLKGFGRSASLELSLTKIPMVMVTHVYDSMDQYTPSVIGGGKGATYISDVIIVLTKGKEKEGKTQTGVILNAKVRKSRFVHENISAKLILSFKKGLYKYSYLTELAQELGVFKKEGISYIMPDGKKARMKAVRTNFGEYASETNLESIREAIKNAWKFGNGEIDIDDVVEEEIENE